MKASERSAMSALRSCMVSTTCSLVTPRWPISRCSRPPGITPITSPPCASAASALNQDYVFGRQLGGRFAQILKQNGAQVTFAKVRHNHHHLLAGVLLSLRNPDCCCNGRATRNSHQQSFLFGGTAGDIHRFI